jgi:HK97 family phage major capsid protein
MSFDNSRLTELQGALRTKMAENKTIADNFKIEDGTVVVSAEQKTAFDKNMADIREIKSLVESLESMRDADQWASEPQSSVAQASAYATSELQQAMQFASTAKKSIGEAFLASAEFKSLLASGSANMPAPYKSDYNVKDLYSALPTGTPGSFGTIQRDAIVVPPMRTKRVRDLFPARTTTAAVIEYFRQLGFTTPIQAGYGFAAGVNSASTIAERNGGNSAFALKPQSSFSFVGEQAPVRTLAHWEAAHRNVLADEPQLRSIIDNELMYGLRLLEDNQILNGDGVGENLLGVMNTPNIQTYAWSDGAALPVKDTKADAIRRAATLSFLAYYEPSGVVLHPNDWEDIELTKDENGQYLIAVSVAMGGEPRVWRMPIIDTPAMTEGTGLVGAFGTAAQLYDREQASIRISEQHSDFFVRNAIVILAEQRLALAVKRPEAFVSIDFDNAPA